MHAGVEPAARALAAMADGDRGRAVELAGQSAAAGSLLGAALTTHLAGPVAGGVYDSPAAFRAFIAGGGNVELYRRTSTALARTLDHARHALDIGCGDGHALLPALAACESPPQLIDLVEPSAALLQTCCARMAAGLPAVTVRAHRWGLSEFLREDTETVWDAAVSSFALQSIETAELRESLTVLVDRVGHLTVVDFDVVDRGPTELAVRWERGLAEYTGATRDLVGQGFLVPVLLGQLDPATPRTNWERSAPQWVSLLRDCGFATVTATPLLDYWSAPAVLFSATGHRAATSGGADRATH